jgi:hypothetical protein
MSWASLLDGSNKSNDLPARLLISMRDERIFLAAKD